MRGSQRDENVGHGAKPKSTGLVLVFCLLTASATAATAPPAIIKAQQAVREGYAQIEAHRPEKACERFREAHETMPQWWIGYFEQARLARWIGASCGDPISLLQQALQLQSHHAILLQEMGFAYDDQNLKSEAINAYQAALKVNPRLLSVRRRLARLEFESGQTEQAVADFRRVLEERPDDLDALGGLARAFMTLEKWAEAESVLFALVARSRGPAIWLAELVRLYQSADQNQARENAQKAWYAALRGTAGSISLMPIFGNASNAGPAVLSPIRP